MIRATILDYGAGNLHSLSKALAMPGVSVQIATDPELATETDVLVLPGVGAFTGAASFLAPARTTIRRALSEGLPCLAICLGMQLLFDASDEGPGAGIGFFAGRVRRVNAALVPHMGWNTLEATTDPLAGHGALTMAYYAHSFACPPADPGATTAWSVVDGDRFPAIVRRQRTLGVQFHPEKSSAPGVRFIHRFLADAATTRAVR